MNIQVFLKSIAQQDQGKFDVVNKNLFNIKDFYDHRSFALIFNNLSETYDNCLLSKTELKNFSPELIVKGWTELELARVYLLVQISTKFEQKYDHIIEELFKTAGISELIALYKSLPFLPEPKKFLFRAQEGTRSNINLVFNAIGLNNTYPMNFFDERSWNHLILKAFFIDSDVSQIIGIEKRVNPTLMTMLTDFAHERVSSGRIVNPELWKLVNLCQDEKF
uniref:Uncharacterized protein n=1 Tax=Vischeria sp. CAUP Q 202 TaxID=1805947 RepID=A0A1D8RDV7_9STRA|nr:hypothetical protein NUH79_pgp081 [Vischeria punctata]AOW70882.1 hypothetical protein [Vischeria sp. CAUP Q 202]UTV00882.1 hypothetical protein [Vischeria punctata]